MRNPLFWFDIIENLILTLLSFVPRFIVAILFLIFFYGIYRAVRRLVVGSLRKASVDESIRDMLGHLLKWTIMGFGIVIACNQVGVEIAALLTGVGVIGLALGLAAQDTLANLIASVVIFWDKPFKVGEWLETWRDVWKGAARHISLNPYFRFERADDHLSEHVHARESRGQSHDAPADTRLRADWDRV